MAAQRLPNRPIVLVGQAAGDGPSGLTLELRARVMARIATFIDAFDMAIASPTAECLDDLHDATDQVTRATARVLIELELLSDRQEIPING